MSYRVVTASFAVLCFLSLLVPCTATAQPGHWRTEAEFLREAGPDWERVAPGVYELRRDNGRVTRLGFGVESFRFALEEKRAELAELAEVARKSAGPGIERRLQKTEETIAFLEESLRRAEVELSAGQAQLANKDDSESGSTCHGNYNLEVVFSCGFTSGSTTSTATWSEFGPFAPYQKELHTVAYAAMDSSGSNAVLDTDDYGPFSNACCVKIQSGATTAGPTFEPWLKGQAYLTVTNGCADFRWVADDQQDAC